MGAVDARSMKNRPLTDWLSSSKGECMPGRNALLAPPAQRATWDSDTSLRRLRHRRAIGLSHHVTWFLGRRFPRVFPFLYVLGYPKSGTSWACQLMADYFQLPFPQYSLLPIGCAAVVHGHEIAAPDYPCAVYVLRDGRDALVSLYFHLLNRSLSEKASADARRQRQARFLGLDEARTCRDNMPAFVQRQMEQPTSCRANWSEHVRSYLTLRNSTMALLRYEDLLADGPKALSAVVHQLSDAEADPERISAALDRYSFQRQTGGQRREQDRSFLRQGRSGDWTKHFNREAAEIFDHYCGDVLIASGYERDRSWVERCLHE